jgi:uncharacterized membrane protein HdeD (DUF308 family)
MTNFLESDSELYFGVKRIHEHWISFLILGVLLVLLGALAITGATFTTLTSMFFFGSLLAIGGVLQAIYAFWRPKGQSFIQNLLLGIFYAIVGVLMFTHPAVSALAITLLLAAFYTVNGIFKICISLTTAVVQRGWLLFSGVVSLALGLLIWSEWPVSGLWIIGLFIGIDLIFIGWFWIMLSLAASKDLPAKP